MKLSQAQAIVEKAITHALDLKDARDAQYVVPYLIGGAGLGKTTIVKDVAASMNMQCSILSLAQYDAGELGGWPVPSKDGTSMIRLKARAFCSLTNCRRHRPPTRTSQRRSLMSAGSALITCLQAG
jgi:predicted ATPase